MPDSDYCENLGKKLRPCLWEGIPINMEDRRDMLVCVWRKGGNRSGGILGFTFLGSCEVLCFDRKKTWGCQ